MTRDRPIGPRTTPPTADELAAAERRRAETATARATLPIGRLRDDIAAVRSAARAGRIPDDLLALVFRIADNAEHLHLAAESLLSAVATFTRTVETYP